MGRKRTTLPATAQPIVRGRKYVLRGFARLRLVRRTIIVMLRLPALMAFVRCGAVKKILIALLWQRVAMRPVVGPVNLTTPVHVLWIQTARWIFVRVRSAAL